MNKKIFKSAKFMALYVAIFIGSLALAATMSVPTVPKLGGGTGTVTSPGNITNFTWTLTGSAVNVTGVSLKFDTALNSGGIIYVYMEDASGNVLATGSQTLASTLAVGTAQPITISPSLAPSAIVQVAVTVVGS